MHVFWFDLTRMQNNVLCIIWFFDSILKYIRIQRILHTFDFAQRDYFNHESTQIHFFRSSSRYIIDFFLLRGKSIHYSREKLFSWIFRFQFVFDVFFKFFIIFLIFDHMSFLKYSRIILFLKNFDIFINVTT